MSAKGWQQGGMRGKKGEVHRQHSYSYRHTQTHTVGHRLPPSERCYTEINVTLLCCLCLLACSSPLLHPLWLLLLLRLGAISKMAKGIAIHGAQKLRNK